MQAANTLDSALRNALVCIRLYTTKEMIDVLNGHLPNAPVLRVPADLERYALAHADRILWPGGDILNTYARFYDGALAPAQLVRHPVLTTPTPVGTGERPTSETLRLLYIGRLERRKGVRSLLRAVTGLVFDDWQLTLVGGDTKTGSLGTSIRSQLEMASAEDPRINFKSRVPREEVFSLFRSHDVVVAPSIWECWPNLVLEAMSQSQPVLATPVGGHLELVSPGRSGWLTSDAEEEALATSLEHLFEHRDEISTIAQSEGPSKLFEELTNVDSVREVYAELATQSPRKRSRKGSRSTPLVSVVVPYFEVDEYVEESIGSIFAQTYQHVEVIVVNDGSFREEDRVLYDLAQRFPLALYTQQNSGLGRARNFAISQSRGKYVLTLDPDDVLEPSFTERCVEVLETRPDVCYVNCWVRYVGEEGDQWGPPDHGHRPFSNEGLSLDVLNIAGSATALFRRRVFDLGHWYSSAASPSYEDWLLYRELAASNLFGHTIPELLLRYRIRSGSMSERSVDPTACASRTRWPRICGRGRCRGRRRAIDIGRGRGSLAHRRRAPSSV